MTYQAPNRPEYSSGSQRDQRLNEVLITRADQITLAADIRRWAMKEIGINFTAAQQVEAQAVLTTHSMLTQNPQVGPLKEVMDELLLNFLKSLNELLNEANQEIIHLSGADNKHIYRSIKEASMLSEISYGQLYLTVVFVFLVFLLVIFFASIRVLLGAMWIVTVYMAPYLGEFLLLLLKAIWVIAFNSFVLLLFLGEALFKGLCIGSIYLIELAYWFLSPLCKLLFFMCDALFTAAVGCYSNWYERCSKLFLPREVMDETQIELQRLRERERIEKDKANEIMRIKAQRAAEIRKIGTETR